MAYEANELIDLETYPIAKSGSRRGRIVADVRTDLEARGCAVLKGFLTKAGVSAAVAEAERGPVSERRILQGVEGRLIDPDD